VLRNQRRNTFPQGIGYRPRLDESHASYYQVAPAVQWLFMDKLLVEIQ